MNSTFLNGQRNFSFSSHHGQPQYQQPPFQFDQYINPAQARHALLVHYQNEQQNSKRFEDSYKTVMCENWLERAHCDFGKNCRFAHGFEEIRPSRNPPPINSKYKTRPCEKYVKRGICPYGERCLFIHPERDSNSSLTPSSPSIERPLIPSLLSWTPPSDLSNLPMAPAPPPTPLYDSTIPPPPFKTSSINPPATTNSNSSFAFSFPMVQPPRTVLGSIQNQRMMAANLPNKSRNLFPQILEELQKEKENSAPSQTKKWSDLEEPTEMDTYEHQKEMERIVEKLVASPMILAKRDCNLT